jgi:uncharacterized membrane protein
MGHSHAAGEAGADRPVGSPTRLLLGLLVAPFVIATAVGLVVLWPADATPPAPEFIGPPAELHDASVTKVERRPCAGTADSQGVVCQQANARLSGGPQDGHDIPLEVSEGIGSPILYPGDRIVVGRVASETSRSGEAGDTAASSASGWYFADYQRKAPLLLLGACFGLAVMVLGRWRGVFALAGLAVSLVVLVRFVLPAILGGANPVWVAVVGSAAVMFAALYLAHGVNARTTTAVLGTMGALLLTGLLAWAFVEATHLTGMASEEAGFVQAAVQRVSLRGLLLGGVVIGSLGVLDDVTVTQASAVWELHQANPAYGVRHLFSAGLRIGRDHIASTVNTLVFAYAGASLPLLVLFTLSNRNLGDVLTGEIVAQEIVRTLVGSIGLVAAVPLTTGLAAVVAARETAQPSPVSLSQASAASASRPTIA